SGAWPARSDGKAAASSQNGGSSVLERLWTRLAASQGHENGIVAAEIVVDGVQLRLAAGGDADGQGDKTAVAAALAGYILCCQCRHMGADQIEHDGFEIRI